MGWADLAAPDFGKESMTVLEGPKPPVVIGAAS